MRPTSPWRDNGRVAVSISAQSPIKHSHPRNPSMNDSIAPAVTSDTITTEFKFLDGVKIENPKMGDPGRRLRPGQPDTDPYYFHVFNANKKSITVNLKSEAGLNLVKEMLKKADVCMENFAPGAIERLGLGYDVVKALNPSIIYAQVKGFGEGSPYEKNLAFDMIAQACGGTFSVTGDQIGRAPCGERG